MTEVETRLAKEDRAPDWRKRTAIALVVAGLVLILGGWKFTSAGDTVYVWPEWVAALGGMLMATGGYLYIISRKY
jgi:hypothetical protein